MARKPLTRQDRIDAVVDAAEGLDALIRRAIHAETSMSDEDVCACPEGNAAGITEAECGCAALKAWEAVETHGATIHRQARLLAGKSRGG